MAIRFFEQIQENETAMGGKAWGLARLTQLGFPVPRGLVLTSLPTESEWLEVLIWWRELDFCPLAVRSSAGSEDSKEHSFAGQNQSFLNQKTEAELKKSVAQCFNSIKRSASLAYREYFGEDVKGSGMNVVLQRMVDPRFAGVFFSIDPRKGFNSGWILEVISGLGEDLVSGHVTPGRVTEAGVFEGLPQGFTKAQANEVATLGLKVREQMGFEVDIEWAIDQFNTLYLLQTRPITTLKQNENKDFLEEEKKRLELTFSKETVFDGQTFSEWSGLPSYFTYSLWREVFTPKHSFGEALKRLGYESFSEKEDSGHSLLVRVFGRAYLNLTELSDLYYGPIPFSIVSKPRPHTQFEWKKVNFNTLKHFPAAVICMIKVAWNVSTRRKEWLNDSSRELLKLSQSTDGPKNPKIYENMSFVDLIQKLKEKTDFFSKSLMIWPLVLVVLTESTLQRLRLMMCSVFGEKIADEKIRELMAHGLHTITLDMQKAYAHALAHPTERDFFIAQFGHRGPGEMDLKNPRWFELSEKAWIGNSEIKIKSDQSSSIEAEIKAYPTYKREVILEEWRLLKSMLELREQWKMEILKPYAEIRLCLLEISKRVGLQQAIHWLRLNEVLELKEQKASPELWNKISRRQEKAHAFKSYSFPEISSLDEVIAILDGKRFIQNFDSVGEALSPGLATGNVRMVKDPSQVNLSDWPEKVILVAETTDPGWTSLFVKASAIIVEKGGVLSHCAIVAREMGIPAISGLSVQMFKEGEQITVDGNHGRVYR